MKKIIYLVFAFCLLTDLTTFLHSETLYFNERLGYGDFSKFMDVGLTNRLVTTNSTDKEIFNLVNIDNHADDINFEIRFANKHNDENKKYNYFQAGKKKSITNPIYGIVWNYKDSCNYCQLILKCNNTYLGNSFDTRSLWAQVLCVENSIGRIVHKSMLTKNVDLYTGYNSINISIKNDTYLLTIGNKKLIYLCSVENIKQYNKSSIGYFIGSGAQVDVDYIIINKMHTICPSSLRLYSESDLVDLYRKKNDTYEGVWLYLDRDLNNTQFKLGGKYELGLKKTDYGYDIIYLGGSKINAKYWKKGMIKGILQETKFQNQFLLTWYDSNGLPLNNEVRGKFYDPNILELQFPIQKCILRFYKK